MNNSSTDTVASATGNSSNATSVTQNENHSHVSLDDWVSQDLAGSAITDRYLRSLVKPIRGKDKIAHNLNWKSWTGTDGWESVGVDVDGNTEWGSYEFKPQTPVTWEDGKVQKYLARKGSPRRCYLPLGELLYFKEFRKSGNILPLIESVGTDALDWHLGKFLLEFPEIPIFITEGTKKCLCGWNKGLTTISVPGVYGWHEKGSPQTLRPMLESLFPDGQKPRQAYLCFDADSQEKESVRGQLIKFSKELERRGHTVKICVWNIKDGKGMDDFIANGGDFNKVIELAMTIAQWEKQFPEPKAKGKTNQKKGSGSAKLSPIEKAQLAINGLGVHLRFNELSKEIESSPGEGVDGDALWVAGCADPDLYTSVDTFYRVLGIEAKKDSYHPIQEYLKGCHEKYGDDVSVLNDIARRYLGTSDSLHQTFLVKWLIGAVARAMTPGCKMDTALVLHGSQGIGKSTFFNILGGDWFTDSLDKLDSSNKDELLKAHQSWLIELAEIENAFSKTAISKIKQSMSATTDQIRPPYGRKTEKCKRGFVICGTTNQTQFLNDPTGSRRFWVISCNGRVNRELLTQERDQIWGAAYALWARGEKWYLTEFEEEALAINNEGYESQDPWVEFLRDALLERGEQETTIKECFEHLDMPEPKSHNSREARRIKDCLTHLGYKPEKFYRDGKQVRGWAIESLDKLNQNFGNSLSQLSQDAGTQSAQAFDNKTVQQNLLSHTVSTVSTDDDGDAEQDRQDSGKTVQDSTLSHTQTHTGQGIQGDKTVETVKPQTFNQNDLPFSRGDNVWVTTVNGKRKGTIANPPDKYGEWGVEFKNSKGEWMSHRFPSEGLSPREKSDGYSVGDNVWVEDAQGVSMEGVITHPQNKDGKWGLKVNIGTKKDECWNGTYYYSPDKLTPREE